MIDYTEAASWRIFSAAFIVFFFLTDIDVLASDGTSVTFQNSTNATIRVDRLTESGDGLTSSGIVAPRGELTIPALAGNREFDLVAYRANPVRIHKIIIKILPNVANTFHIIPHIMGVYLLDDADLVTPSATPTVSTRQLNKTEPTEAYINRLCAQAVNSGAGRVLWSMTEDIPAQYYHEWYSNVLCAIDGTSIYWFGSNLEYFDCANSWIKCRRNSEHDVKLSPPIETSNFDDFATRLVMKMHSRTSFVRTQTLDWLNANRPQARLTEYYYSARSKKELECPDGYRLHYQGQCINLDDELADNPEKGVRMIDPVSK